IIYPQKVNCSTQSEETYILGNITPNSDLTINNEKVKIWDNNIFCHIVKLQDGKNEIKIEEKSQNGVISKIYTVTKYNFQNQQKISKNCSSNKTKIFNDLMFGKVILQDAPIREKPSENGNRISHLPLNTVLLIQAENDNWYKIYTANEKENIWISKKNVKLLYPTNNRYVANIKNVEFCHDKNFQTMKIYFDIPIPYKMLEINNDIDITLWGIKDISKIQKAVKKQKIFDNIQIKNFENNNMTLSIESNKNLFGYDAYYENNTFVFKKRKIPKISSKKPLGNIIVAIDAGHGGKELGTVGPERIPEKDINLAISLKLKDCLEQQGAKVIMTRCEDKDVEIYQRPDIANENNALILISIHANSMVDGNPYKNHGVETYYYHNQAKNLADIIKKQMVNDLKLKDNGTKYASFVLTRPTMPISVLIEVAYMPNPEEYLLLINDDFQQNTAISITKGIKNYFLNMYNFK
ncbi:N-acetylmuramoyl-L-alanine amidase, partial [bacterium]|nr:N-acetylmuramoyl-L-alanine amidase [bacterium]